MEINFVEYLKAHATSLWLNSLWYALVVCKTTVAFTYTKGVMNKGFLIIILWIENFIRFTFKSNRKDSWEQSAKVDVPTVGQLDAF